ncbi:hypothetical protein NEFER03_0057 [Nematocida sp. LUAm3]|nr:hypothetical protein NEFER03_0057 [Nematocida sp. LUAm3]KAI5173510.1 hypothetical protein NEFER02_0026 [Nematocida sp. LUAm2]KAI5176731.1 hypothetical protein NEFER01_0056 [Nematocida sp. LUAm1]
METEKKEETHSYNAQIPTEQLRIRNDFYIENKKKITEIIGIQKTERIYRTYSGGSLSLSVAGGNSSHIKRILRKIRKCLFFKENDIRINSVFSYSNPPLRVPQGLEVLMRYFVKHAAHIEQSLFRQRTSQKKTNELTQLIIELNKGKYYKIDIDIDSVVDGGLDGGLDDIIDEDADDINDANINGEVFLLDSEEKIEKIYKDIGKFDMISAGVVFKMIIKGKKSLFPIDAVYLFLENWKFLNYTQQCILCRFIFYFILSKEQRERLEVVLSFLEELSTQKGSPLTLKNLSILFAPIFFIDKSFEVEENFKDTLLILTDVLEFMFNNTKMLLLIE